MTILNKMKLWGYMLQDMKEPVSYLPQSVLIGLAVVAAGFFLLFIIKWIKKEPLTGRNTTAGEFTLRICVLFLFSVYLTVLLQEAFFSRPPGSRTSVDLELFGTWGHSAQGNAYVIENVIMFVPWGLLLPVLIRPFGRGAGACLCILSGFLASVSLETAQYFTQRGHCQLDDVVMNTLGTLAGWLIFKLLACILFSRRSG